MQVPVTFNKQLQDINGSFLLEWYHQDEAHADQVRYFLGNSLPPLLFCMALNSLSVELCSTGYSYWMNTGHTETAKCHLVSHLLYKNDLKLYDKNSDQLKKCCCTQFIPSLMTTREVWSGQMFCCTLCQWQAFYTISRLNLSIVTSNLHCVSSNSYVVSSSSHFSISN